MAKGIASWQRRSRGGHCQEGLERDGGKRDPDTAEDSRQNFFHGSLRQLALQARTELTADDHPGNNKGDEIPRH